MTLERPDGIYLLMVWGGKIRNSIGFQFRPDSSYDEMALGISSAVEGMLRKAAELEKDKQIAELQAAIANLQRQLETKDGDLDR